MLKYMTNNGIAVAAASTIMLVAKFWDAITDPVMGFISDNTRGRFGRRKPYMFFGRHPAHHRHIPDVHAGERLGVTVGGFTAYIVVMYILWNTFIHHHDGAVLFHGERLSPSFKERNNANTVKLVFNAAASGLAYVLPLLFVDAWSKPEGFLFVPNLSSTEFWLAIAIIFGVLFGGGLIICGLFVKERIKPTSPKEQFNGKQFVKNYVEPYKNRSYRWHIVMLCPRSSAWT